MERAVRVAVLMRASVSRRQGALALAGAV